MKTVVGIDYGTQSARAVLVDAENGQVICSHTAAYPHGVMEGDLACAQDYEEALIELLEQVTPAEYKKSVKGICVDATSLTLVPVCADGRALSSIPKFSERHHANIKLWKCHEAQAQADEALILAQKLSEPILKRTGGNISSEWTLPKLLKIRDEDPEIYHNIDLALDLCEFLTFKLTGKLTRSMASMCYKGLWAQDLLFPSNSFLNGLRNNFAEEYRHKMRGTVLAPGKCAGFLRPELCSSLGLEKNVVVASGTPDGYNSMVALGAWKENNATLVMGTSHVLTIQSGQLYEPEGICGIAMDGMFPGLYGIECGQNATGDMLEWFLKNTGTQKQEHPPFQHQILSEQIKRPWENQVIAIDWWNGSRNVPCDLNLRGMMYGLSLDTKPEDIYLALLQAIACGTREILEQCEAYGISVNRLTATGGISQKNQLLMQEYANILNRKIYVGQIQEGPALGAAIFASVASEIHKTPEDAYQHMGVKNFSCYEPDISHRTAYEELYFKNHTLRNMLLKWKQSL